MERDPGQTRARGSETALPGTRFGPRSGATRRRLGWFVQRLAHGALLLENERIVESNPAAEFLLGRTRADLIDRPWTAILVEPQPDRVDSRACLDELIQASLAGGQRASRLCRFRRPDGSTCEGKISLTALQDGRHRWALALICHPPEQQPAEPAQDAASRWEQLGKLSWGIAHDLNNLLTAIDGGLDKALAGGSSSTEIRQGLSISRASVRRAARLNRRLLDLCRDKRFAPRAVAIDPLIQAIVSAQVPDLGSEIEIVFEAHAHGLFVDGDPAQLEQIIVNLLRNARDAMPQGGRLRVSTSAQDIGAEFVERHPWARPGRFVRIEVRDSGVGIPYELQPRVFEPFFTCTTEREGHGLGLGLSIVYGIVKQHRGFIDLSSSPGAGTCFWMLFPSRLTNLAASTAPAEPPTTRSVKAGAAVLVVEDDAMVRELAVSALRGRGFRILQAACANEAETAFAENLDTVDVLVADLMLTGLGGFELAQRFRTRKPELRVLFTSGYDIGQLPRDVVKPGGAEFLQKPYTLRALTERVESMLRSE